MKYADEYVWVYSESPRWWSDTGSPVKLSPAYDAAIRRAVSNQTRPLASSPGPSQSAIAHW